LSPGFLKNYGRSLFSAAFFFANVTFFRQVGYFDLEAESKPLLHTWSLSVEEQFYIFFPLFLWFLFKKFPARRNMLIFGVALLSFLGAVFFLSRNASAVFYLLPFRVWELLAGALAALDLPLPRLKEGFRLPLSLLGLAGLLLPVFLYTPDTPFPGAAALPPVLGAALLLYIHKEGVAWSPVGRLLARPLPVGIGRISYALYLWHWPLLVIPRGIKPEPLSLPETSLLLALITLLSVLSWRFIEKPVRSGVFLPRRKELFAASLVAMLLLFGTGRFLVKSKGAPWRVPENVLAYLAVAEEGAERIKNSLSVVEKYGAQSIGAPGEEPSFLLWGDSHAASLLPGVESLAGEYGLSGLFYAKSGCLPWFGPPNRGLEANSACDAFNAKVPELLADGKIRHVLMAFVGGHADVTYDRRNLKKMEEARRVFRARFLDMLQLLKKQTDVTLWFAPVIPVYSFSVPEYLGVSMLAGGDPSRLRLKEGDLVKNTYELMLEIRPPLGRPLRFEPPICQEGLCLPGDGGGPFYIDGNHLTSYAALYFKNSFREMFEAVAAGHGNSPRGGATTCVTDLK
jgi:peptidoglycan/LPS O-acetylase OafA/YrhL